MENIMDNLVVADVESIGIKLPHIIETAFLNVKTEELVTFRTRPPVPIEHQAFLVHGISNEEIEKYSPFKGTYTKLVQEMVDSSILIGHNISFDLRAFELESIATHRSCICTQKLAGILIKHGIIPKMSKQLQLIRQALGIEEDTSHSAAGDIRVTLQVFNRMRKVFATLYSIKDIDDPALIKKMIEDTNISPRKQTMFFGDYKGIEFKDIYKENPQYLKKLFAKDDFPLGAKRDIYNLYKAQGEDLGFYEALREPVFF